MRTIDTGYVDILSSSSSADTSNVLTGAIPCYDIREVQADVFIRAKTLCQVRIGVQFSTNPLNFTDAPKELAAAYKSTLGWNDDSTWTNIFTLASTTPRVFVRFVALAKNTSGSGTESMQIRVRIRIKPLRARLVTTEIRRGNTKGTDASSAICPISDPIAVEGFGEHRVHGEVSSMTGGVEATLGWQETDTPDDPTTWSSATAIGSAVTSDGTIFGTTFTSVSFTKKYVRYVASVKNSAGGTAVEACHLAMRLELRST
jgi:hypothetical protein